jgi:glycosyltransferase involved in cell wall biosynthesis
MTLRHAEILYLAPSDPYRSGLADYGHSYLNAIQEDPYLSGTPLLNMRVPERLHGHLDAIPLVRKMTEQVLKSVVVHPDQILQIEMDWHSQREYWAALEVTRLRPDLPICLIFHDPPHLPERVRQPAQNPKTSFIERLIQRISRALSTYSQKRLERELLEKAVVFMAPSRRGAQLLVEQYPEFARKVACLPPVVLGTLPPEPPQPHQPMDHTHITLFGFIRPDKGIPEFLRAIAFLNKREPLEGRVLIRLGGRTSLEGAQNQMNERLRDLMKDLEIEKLIEFFPGALTEAKVNELLMDSDVVVLPYRTGFCNGCSKTLMRVAAWGVSVIASDVGSIREIIEHEKTGLLYPPGDTAALADAINRIIKDPHGRLKMARALQEKVYARYTPSVVAPLLREVYAAVLEAHRKQRPVVLPEAVRMTEPPIFEESDDEIAPDGETGERTEDTQPDSEENAHV